MDSNTTMMTAAEMREKLIGRGVLVLSSGERYVVEFRDGEMVS